MDLALLAGVLRTRATIRSHDRWTRPQLVANQERALRDLRAFAIERSPFYRELHRGYERAPLHELPVATKQMVMDNFDSVVTDRDVRLQHVLAYLEHARADGVFRGRYRVAATGGTTGRRGIFLADPREWQAVLASYSRAYDWAGVAAGLTHRLRMAVVSSRNPTHQSSIVGATVASPMTPTLRLDATQPIEDIVRELNGFQPAALVGYASMVRILAGEQRAGRLRIRPAGIFSASEVLTAETRALAQEAFGVSVTNVYAATETAGIASECRRGRMHVYEDFVIPEIVDGDGRPVPAGTYGAKLLVTVLFSHTQPLIRYELSDRVAALPGLCDDGLPFSLLAGIEGREEETLRLGGVTIHPNVFHRVLEPLPAAGWQVIESGGRLRVLLAQARDADPTVVASAVGRALGEAGARGIPVAVELVDAIPRTALGKAPLVWRNRLEARA